jgi:hypothetical protein
MFYILKRSVPVQVATIQNSSGLREIRYNDLKMQAEVRRSDEGPPSGS